MICDLSGNICNLGLPGSAQLAQLVNCTGGTSNDHGGPGPMPSVCLRAQPTIEGGRNPWSKSEKF
jgi:hypothetical protein